MPGGGHFSVADTRQGPGLPHRSEVEHSASESKVARVVVDSVGERWSRLVHSCWWRWCRPGAGADADIAEDDAPQWSAPRLQAERRGLRRFDSSVRRVSFGEVPAGRSWRQRSRSALRTPAPFGDLAFILSLRYAKPSNTNIFTPRAVYRCRPTFIEPDRVTGLEPASTSIPADRRSLSAETIDVRNLHVPNNRKLADAAAFTVMMFGPCLHAPNYGPLARDFYSRPVMPPRR
jgi:hypothetical protein